MEVFDHRDVLVGGFLKAVDFEHAEYLAYEVSNLFSGLIISGHTYPVLSPVRQRGRRRRRFGVLAVGGGVREDESDV